MKPFRHLNAESLDQALDLLSSFGPGARIIAGGTDLLGVLKAGIVAQYPEALINLKTVPGLDRIALTGQSIRIGALARLADLAENPELNRTLPALVQAAFSVGSPELRNRATLGGNLCQETRCWYFRYPDQMGGRMDCFRKGHGPCHAVTGDNRYHALFGAKKCFAVGPSDLAVALAALGARLTILGPRGERQVEVKDFYDVMGPRLEPDQILTQVEVPAPVPGNRQKFSKFRLREAIDFAVVSVAVSVDLHSGKCQEPCVVLGAVAPGPYPALAAQESLADRALDDEAVREAAQAAVSGARPLSRNGYKIDLIRTLVKRTLNDLR